MITLTAEGRSSWPKSKSDTASTISHASTAYAAATLQTLRRLSSVKKVFASIRWFLPHARVAGKKQMSTAAFYRGGFVFGLVSHSRTQQNCRRNQMIRRLWRAQFFAAKA